MTTLEAAAAAMGCPRCGVRVVPDADSTANIAWYGCPRCEHLWSARLRDGQPALTADPIDVSSLLPPVRS